MRSGYSFRKAGRRSDRGLVITNPEKVLFPEDGITKGELAAYYEAVAPARTPARCQRLRKSQFDSDFLGAGRLLEVLQGCRAREMRPCCFACRALTCMCMPTSTVRRCQRGSARAQGLWPGSGE